MRAQFGTTEEEYQQSLQALQKDFASAKKVVIVGAGSVGLEIAGVGPSPLGNDTEHR